LKYLKNTIDFDKLSLLKKLRMVPGSSKFDYRAHKSVSIQPQLDRLKTGEALSRTFKVSPLIQ
jgi:hypothetical protein